MTSVRELLECRGGRCMMERRPHEMETVVWIHLRGQALLAGVLAARGWGIPCVDSFFF